MIAANGILVDSLEAYLDARSVYDDRLELTVQRANTVLDFVLYFERRHTSTLHQRDVN